MGLFCHSEDGLPLLPDTTVERRHQARINMVLDCLDAGDAEAALKVWRAEDWEIVLPDPVMVDLEDVMWAGLLARAEKGS